MSALLLVLVVILGVIAWLLSVPLELKIEIDTLSTQKARFRLYWFYGLLTFSSEGPKPGPATAQLRPSAKKQKVPRAKPRQNGRFMLAMLKSDGFVRRIAKLLTDCLRIIDFREPRLYCRFGLDSPADTGQCLGVVAPLFILLRQRLIPTAHLEPDFNEAVLIIQAGSRIRVVPLHYVLILLQFLFSPELWRGIRSAIKARNA